MGRIFFSKPENKRSIATIDRHRPIDRSPQFRSIATALLPTTNLLDEVFPDFCNQYADQAYIASRGILTPLNEDVQVLNTLLLQKIQTKGQVFTYLSADRVASTTDDPDNIYARLPQEYLNSLTPSGVAPHKLIIQQNVPLMLLRNLNPAAGMCNGTRLIAQRFTPRTVHATIMSGTHANQQIILPRIDMSPGEAD